MSAANIAPLLPDPSVIQEWCDHWFHHCTRGEIQIGWHNAQTGKLAEFRTFPIGSNDIGEFVARINSVPGQSCYVRASTVREGLGRTAAKDADFVQAPGPWGDLDDAGALDRANKVEAIIRPSAWVQTGEHPHWRAQCFWRLEAACEDPVVLKALNERVVALYQGDANVVNPARLMRMPGTVAWPSKPERVPERTKLIISTKSSQSYSLEFLMRSFPQVSTSAGGLPKPVVAPVVAGNIPPCFDTSCGLMERIKRGDQWHNNMVRLVAHWIGRDWSNPEILATAEGLTLHGYTVAQTRAEMAKAIEGGRRKWGVPDRQHEVKGNGPAAPFAGAPFDPWETLRPLVFPMDALPTKLAAYANSRARAIGCDPAAVAMCCLSALSVALDGQSRLRMKRHDGWTVPPTLWVALIGASSTRKSPAMKAAWAPLERRQKVILRNYTAALAAWEAKPKGKRDDEPPPPARYVTHDGTMEAVQDILESQDRGLGMVRDELAGFIGALEKYSGGKGGAADRAFYLTAFEGGAHVVDRVGRGTVAIGNLLLAICGGIQPARLASFGDLTDDGLWQRFMPVIMAPGELGQDTPEGNAEAAYDALVDYFLGLPPLDAVLSHEAMVERQAVERRLHGMEQADPLGGAFTSFIGKLHGIWGRLALVLHVASRPAQDKGDVKRVELATAKQASRLVFDFILPSAARVYVTMGGGSSKGEPMKDVAGYILTKKLERVLASDLTRNVRCARGMGLAEVQRLVSPLVAGAWLAPEKDHAGNNAWLVNAGVHEQFAVRAAREANRRAEGRALLMENLAAKK